MRGPKALPVQTAPLVTAAHSPAERHEIGAALRAQTPRGAQAEWSAPADREDPVRILIDQGRSRVKALLPVRYARMAADPFGFLRGSAAVMAADLARTVSTGYKVQSSGDAHLDNFGAYPSADSLPVFDVNDFDETLPAPFEWDLKRLAASLVVAARVDGYGEKPARALAHAAARAYREHMAQAAHLTPLEAWAQRIDLPGAIAEIEKPKLREAEHRRMTRVLASGAAHYDLVVGRGAKARIRDKPPLVYHLSEHALPARKAFAAYNETLQESVRVLLARYTLRDVAFKAVGVGSVGTFCAIILLTAGDGSPLLLQLKEAQASVLEPFAGPSGYPNHGERVVVGQRMMQATTDGFLGFTLQPIRKRCFYVRKLKDGGLADIGARLQASLPFYASLCGRTLARAHARAGDAALISGYAGKGEALDDAIAAFAVAYADQTEKDFAAFKAAVKSGRIVAKSEV